MRCAISRENRETDVSDATDYPAPRHVWPLLLAAVEDLHDRGFAGIRALPYFGPVGYWRLEVTTADNLPNGVDLPPRDEDAVFRATEGAFPHVGDLTVSIRTSARDVADEILRGLGSPSQVRYFNDADYCRWFAAMRHRAEEIGAPPSAFEDFHSGWRCGTEEIDPPPGWAGAT